jgi:digeranylgeranylglycerophospholipid reductase
MESFDIVVIGGGPAGSMAALTASEKGLSVFLAERHPVIGCPVRCAEGVAEAGLREFFEPRPEWIAAEVDTYCLVSPDGTRVMIDSASHGGYILERTIFDRMIAERAAGAGAHIVTAAEATSLSPFEGGYRTVTVSEGGRMRELRARVVIAADGVESRAARMAGLSTHASIHDMHSCAQKTLAGIEFEPHTIRMYFTNRYAPGGYAWLFPKRGKTANVGLGVSGDLSAGKTALAYLDEFIDAHFPGASAVSRTVGGVSCRAGMNRIVADGLMVCGDAAHMVNPITGGGIINALIAGRIAGETAADALRDGPATARSLAPYEKRCTERFISMNRKIYEIKEGILDIPDRRFDEMAHELIDVPIGKRTPVRILRSAVMHQPKLLLLLAKVAI